jgi:Cof subfamily protein (haloacid dehalogenase superfamily)
VIQLVCLDVDGTLVGASGQPTDGVWAAADRARSAGIHLAMCTARIAIGGAWSWATRLDPDGWHLFQTGASIVHTADRRTRSTTLPDGALAACSATASERGWTLELYSDFDYTVDEATPTAVDHAALLGVAFERRALSTLRGAAVRAQFIVGDHDVAAAVAAAPVGCTASAATSPRMPGCNFVSITADTVSKASSIRTLAAMLSLNVDEVMMVGDGQNDVSALSVVGLPVAMGNAHADAIAVSRIQVSDVEEDGVAEALDLAIATH